MLVTAALGRTVTTRSSAEVVGQNVDFESVNILFA
jgi:hypothetical protein